MSQRGRESQEGQARQGKARQAKAGQRNAGTGKARQGPDSNTCQQPAAKNNDDAKKERGGTSEKLEGKQKFCCAPAGMPSTQGTHSSNGPARLRCTRSAQHTIQVRHVLSNDLHRCTAAVHAASSVNQHIAQERCSIENRGTVPRYAAHTSRAAQTSYATTHLPQHSNEAVPALTCTWHRGWAALQVRGIETIELKSCTAPASLCRVERIKTMESYF